MTEGLLFYVMLSWKIRSKQFLKIFIFLFATLFGVPTVVLVKIQLSYAGMLKAPVLLLYSSTFLISIFSHLRN